MLLFFLFGLQNPLCLGVTIEHLQIRYGTMFSIIGPKNIDPIWWPLAVLVISTVFLFKDSNHFIFYFYFRNSPIMRIFYAVKFAFLQNNTPLTITLIFFFIISAFFLDTKFLLDTKSSFWVGAPLSTLPTTYESFYIYFSINQSGP